MADEGIFSLVMRALESAAVQCDAGDADWSLVWCNGCRRVYIRARLLAFIGGSVRACYLDQTRAAPARSAPPQGEQI